jgi:hypothetical protein
MVCGTNDQCAHVYISRVFRTSFSRRVHGGLANTSFGMCARAVECNAAFIRAQSNVYFSACASGGWADSVRACARLRLPTHSLGRTGVHSGAKEELRYGLVNNVSVHACYSRESSIIERAHVSGRRVSQ